MAANEEHIRALAEETLKDRQTPVSDEEHKAYQQEGQQIRQNLASQVAELLGYTPEIMAILPGTNPDGPPALQDAVVKTVIQIVKGEQPESLTKLAEAEGLSVEDQVRATLEVFAKDVYAFAQYRSLIEVTDIMARQAASLLTTGAVPAPLMDPAALRESEVVKKFEEAESAEAQETPES